MINPTLQAIAETWKCSEAQIATETSPVHFCGVEIRKLQEKNGLVLSQDSYEQEMLEKWKITGTANWPQFKTPDPEAEVERATVWSFTMAVNADQTRTNLWSSHHGQEHHKTTTSGIGCGHGIDEVSQGQQGRISLWRC